MFLVLFIRNMPLQEDAVQPLPSSAQGIPGPYEAISLSFQTLSLLRKGA